MKNLLLLLSAYWLTYASIAFSSITLPTVQIQQNYYTAELATSDATQPLTATNSVAVATNVESNAENSNQSIADSVSSFIIGGITPIERLPFFARLILHKEGSKLFTNICGATIVNDTYIMTAAHCVNSDIFINGWNENDLRILVKNTTMDNVYVDEFKKVKTITLHPDYDPNDLWNNDIAIIELAAPITDNVRSITLPQDFGDYSNLDSYQIFGLGLTTNQNNSIAGTILFAEIMPLSDTECADLTAGFNEQETLCANGFPNVSYTGICQGDSGGPLTYLDPNGNYQQIGIISYGSTDCESASIPSVFTEIFNYVDWIEIQTSSGVKTIFNNTLYQIENYHSQGDKGFDVSDITTTALNQKTTSTSSGSSGSSFNFWGLILLFGIALKRQYPRHT